MPFSKSLSSIDWDVKWFFASRLAIVGGGINVVGLIVVILFGPTFVQSAAPSLPALLANLIIFAICTGCAAAGAFLGQKYMSPVIQFFLGIAACGVGATIAGVAQLSGSDGFIAAASTLVGITLLTASHAACIGTSSTPLVFDLFPPTIAINKMALSVMNFFSSLTGLAMSVAFSLGVFPLANLVGGLSTAIGIYCLLFAALSATWCVLTWRYLRPQANL